MLRIKNESVVALLIAVIGYNKAQLHIHTTIFLDVFPLSLTKSFKIAFVVSKFVMM